MTKLGRNDPAAEKLLAYTDRLFLGLLDAHEYKELQQLLAKNPQLQRLYLKEVEIETALRELNTEQNVSVFVKQSPKGSWTKIAVAACVGLICCGWWFYSVVTQSHDNNALETQSLATLMITNQCQWEHLPMTSKESISAPGCELSAGKLALGSGLAIIRLHGGTSLVLEGNCDLELISRGLARLNHGRVMVHAPDEAIGFRLLTPTGEVEDLGTEFFVDVKDQKNTTVEVLEGEVLTKLEHQTSGDESKVKKLRKNESLEFHGADDAAIVLTANSSIGFAEIVHENIGRQAGRILALEHFDAHEDVLPSDSTRTTVSESIQWSESWKSHAHIDRNIDLKATTPGARIRQSDQGPFARLNQLQPDSASNLGYLEFPPGGTLLSRPLRHGIDFKVDGETYVSGWMYRAAVQSNEVGTLQSHIADDWEDSLRITFRDQNLFWGDSLSFQLGPTGRPAIQTSLSRIFAAPMRLRIARPVLMIAKIETRQSGPDQVWLRVYEDDESVHVLEPSVWTCSTGPYESDACLNLALVTGTGSCWQAIDELRIGSTWYSVLPSKPLTDD